MAGLVIVHLFFLHTFGSSNPSGLYHGDKVPFYPYFFLKDLIGAFVFFFFYSLFVFYYPNTLGHFDNYIEANPFVTPTHIVPEWYFLPFYAILRSIPDKLGGVVCMVVAILILLLLPVLDRSRLFVSPAMSFVSNVVFWLFVFDSVLLGWLGGMPVESPYVCAGQVATVFYFLYFIVFVPVLSILSSDVIPE